jgi:eukaryotic-like serine/threonine-protein kinase
VTTPPAGRLGAALADRYRIERELGAGGMATVYLAQDLKHDRKVAIKVLKPELAAVLGAERFIVEIKTTAALQHPHILPLFDSGEADGFLYYVMPYIQGETIREKLDRETQCGVDEAVRIAREVADALDYAHRHGVIHRDIKPENILLHDGRAMVMDFGIALAVSAAAGGRMTETGLSLGTPHYMSPEQATAEKEISGRSDVYSLATVLYEMLTGDPPHTGASAQQIIMKIITEPAEPVTKYRKAVPANVASALAQALEKLPADRFESARSFAEALTNPTFVGGTPLSAGASTRTPTMGGWLRDARSRVAVGATVVSLLVAIAAFSGYRGSSAAGVADPQVIAARLDFAGERVAGAVTDRANADRPSRTAIALSPDGRVLVFVGRRGPVRQLFARALSAESAVPIAGTEGAESPFLSPDGASVGYWSDGRLMRVGLNGGMPAQVAVVPRINGASWSEDGRIVFGLRGVGLVIVSVNGGAPPDTIHKEGRDMHLPQFTPGADAILFTRNRSRSAGVAEAIEVIQLKTRVSRTLVKDGTDARLLSTGHLIFGRAGKMMAVPFDRARLEVTGVPVVVLDDVMHAQNGLNGDVITGAMQVAVSPSGTLVYLRGGVRPADLRQLAWLDRQGNATVVSAAGTRGFLGIRFSPDERFAAVTTLGARGMHLLDVARGTLQTLPDSTFQEWAIWTPDGKRVVHNGRVGGRDGLVSSVPDGSRSSTGIAGDTPVEDKPVFWSPDGGTLYGFTFGRGLHAIDIASGSRTPVPNLSQALTYPVLSPNGKWLAYSEPEVTGATHVFVQPWPALDRKWKVSSDSGSAPAWTRDGAELVYLQRMPMDSAGDYPSRIMSVQFLVGSEPNPQPPRELFTTVMRTPGGMRAYDVTRDGSRFLVSLGGEIHAPPDEPRIIVNWFSELRRLSVPWGSAP